MTGSAEITTPLSKLDNIENVVGKSLQELFDKTPQLHNRPVICIVNELPVMRANWDHKILSTDVVTFAVMPQGGGGGGAKQIIGAVAMVAVAIFAPYLAPGIGAAIGVTSATGIAMITGGLIAVGGLLISALIRPQVPSIDAPSRQDTTSSPTYSLSAQGNSARLFDPIPKLYGEHVLWPDFASMPWSDYEDNDQYLYQLFNAGLGKYDIGRILIEDTELWNSVEGFTGNFTDVEIQIVEPGESITLFPSAVVSSAEVGQQDLIEQDVWVGPYTVNASGTRVHKLSIDWVMRRGIYYANDSGSLSSHSISVAAEYREIDDAGDPVGSWTTFGSYTYSGATGTAQRRTESIDVPEGRYEVQVKRTSSYTENTRYANDITWAALRGFIPDDSVFEDETLVAVKIKATNQLTNESSRKFNFIQEAIIPVWDGEEWVEQKTRNAVWAGLDMLMNEVYGASTPQSQIDMPTMFALAAAADARGDEFNGVFDTARGLWEAVSMAFQTIRAQPMRIGSVITAFRDEQASIKRGVFTPANIVQNSFEATYVLYDDDSPDSVIVEYYDRRYWAMREVLCQLDGATSENPARITVFGITDRTHAWREGMFTAAENFYRRVFSTWMTEFEGQILIRGDSVAVSTEFTQWGKSAIVTGWNATGLVITLSEPIETADVILLSNKNGVGWGPVNVNNIISDGYQFILEQASYDAVVADMGAIPLSNPIDYDREPTRVCAGSLQDYAKAFKIIQSEPDNEGMVQLSAVIDDVRVYSADQGTPPAEVDPYGPGVIPATPVMRNLIVNLDPTSTTNPVVLNASWDIAAGANSYTLQTSTDGLSWKTVYTGPEASCTFSEPAGLLYVRGAATGNFQGPWTTPDPTPVAYGITDPLPTQPTNLAVTEGPDDQVNVTWTVGARTNSSQIELLTDDVTPGTYDQLQLSGTDTDSDFAFTDGEVTGAGGPWTNYMVRVRGVNTEGTGPWAEFIVTP